MMSLSTEMACERSVDIAAARETELSPLLSLRRWEAPNALRDGNARAVLPLRYLYEQRLHKVASSKRCAVWGGVCWSDSVVSDTSGVLPGLPQQQLFTHSQSWAMTRTDRCSRPLISSPQSLCALRSAPSLPGPSLCVARCCISCPAAQQSCSEFRLPAAS